MNNNSVTIELITILLQEEKTRLNQVDLKLKIVNVYNEEIKLDLAILSVLINLIDKCLITGQTSRALKYLVVLKQSIDSLDLKIKYYNDSLSKRFLK